MTPLVSVMTLCDTNEIQSKQKSYYVWADTGPIERIKIWWLRCKASVKNCWPPCTGTPQKILVNSLKKAAM